MVATCSTTSDRRRYAAGQIAGGLVGGIMLGSLVAVVGVALPNVVRVSLGVGVGLVAIVVTLAGMNPRGYWLSSRRQVPERWCRLVPPGRLGLGFGALLGAGLATPTPIMAPQLLLAVGLITGNVAACVAGGAVYGVVRAIAPIGTATLGVSTQRAHLTVDKTFRAARYVTALLGVATLLLALGGA
jgi:hypothetical protein